MRSILHRKVLQLTAHYEPDGVREVWEAITLIHSRGAARLVEPVYGEFVHTSRTTYQVPSIISLVNFRDTYTRRRESGKQRYKIFVRDRFRCQYCAKRFSQFELTLDHIIPRSRDGSDWQENLATSCYPCNQRKGNRTPDEARMPLLATPSALRYGLDRALLRHYAEERPEWADYLFLGKERVA